jgi:uncharacterized damage-inducible protein DinB
LKSWTLASKDTILKLVKYDKLAFESYERGVRRLGWKEANKNLEIGHLSLKDSLVHILNVHEGLLIAVAQNKPEVWKDPSRRKTNIRSWSDLRRYRDRVWKGIDDLTKGLTDEKLSRIVRIPWFSARYTLEDVFLQASFEEAHHIGEVIATYWQIGQTPPQMMYIPLMKKIRASVK